MAELSSTALFSDASLKGYWKMNGDWTDSSPSGYTLTATNTPTLTTGKFGQAGSFVSASTQYAKIANASCPNLEISGSQTWVCWVKQTTVTSYQCPMGKGTGGSTNHSLLTSADSGGIVYFTLTGLTTTPQITSNGTLTAGVWYHLAGVYDSSAGKIRIYINGALDKEASASGSATATAAAFGIGAMGDGTTPTNGLIDDAAIFSRALTTAEILTLYQESAGGAFLFNML